MQASDRNCNAPNDHHALNHSLRSNVACVLKANEAQHYQNTHQPQPSNETK